MVEETERPLIGVVASSLNGLSSSSGAEAMPFTGSVDDGYVCRQTKCDMKNYGERTDPWWRQTLDLRSLIDLPRSCSGRALEEGGVIGVDVCSLDLD